MNIKIVCEDPSKEKEYLEHIMNHCMGNKDLPMKVIVLSENQEEKLPMNLARIPEKSVKEQREIMEIAGIRMEPYARRVWVKDKELFLTRVQYDILALMVKNPNRVLTKEEFYNEIWPWEKESGKKVLTLSVHIKKIRSKLELEQSSSITIETVWGVGYRLIVPE